MAHSLNSPSSFARRRVCPGSARMEKGLPDSSSVHSAKGTAAHTLGEICLTNGSSPDDHLGEKMGEFKFPNGRIEEFLVDGGMVDVVNVYVDYCRSLEKDRCSMVEQRFELPFIGEDESGTADFVAITDNTLHIVDYKNGRGVVEAYQNIQGLCYGLGAANQFEDYEWDRLQITIVQPRAWHKDGPIRSWSISRDEILDWKMDLSEAAEATRNDQHILNASINCWFCKANYGCKELVKLIEENTKMDLSDPNSTPINPDMLTDDQMVDLIFNKIPLIERWCSSVKDYGQRRAQEKNPLPDTKLVKTRETMRWLDQKEAEDFFSSIDGAFEKKFKSAPQMKKLVGSKEFAKYEEKYTHKTSTGVTLVQADDPRNSVNPSGESEFGNVNLFGD